MKVTNTRFIIELIAWTCFIVFPILLFPTIRPFIDRGTLNPALTGILLTHSLLIVFYYVNFCVLIPRFFFTHKRHYYPLILLSCLTILILLLMSQPGFNLFPSPPFRYPDLTFAFSIIVRFAVVTMISLGIAHIQRLTESEDQKTKSELSYLKAQINPHFLFNTLNSIYALSVKKSDSAPESVSRLSAIMRYVISDAANDLVSAEKELNYINSYIELERLRLTDKVSLEYEVTGDFTGVNMAPLIFIPLIENAFKHGVSTKERSQIIIRISFKEDTVDLHVENTKVREGDHAGTGLGLLNVHKRLTLLYPSKHTLIISDTENKFCVDLKISLT